MTMENNTETLQIINNFLIFFSFTQKISKVFRIFLTYFLRPFFNFPKFPVLLDVRSPVSTIEGNGN